MAEVQGKGRDKEPETSDGQTSDIRKKRKRFAQILNRLTFFGFCFSGKRRNGIDF